MMQNQSGQLTSGFVKDSHTTKRSCVIQSKGRCYRRNRKFLRPIRGRSNSVSKDDVPAYTVVTLRWKTTQSTNNISTTSDTQPNAVPKTTTSCVEKSVDVAQSSRWLSFPHHTVIELYLLIFLYIKCFFLQSKKYQHCKNYAFGNITILNISPK